jgi:hypothetical protein
MYASRWFSAPVRLPFCEAVGVRADPKHKKAFIQVFQNKVQRHIDAGDLNRERNLMRAFSAK